MSIGTWFHLSSLLTLGNTYWNNVSFRAGWNGWCWLSREPEVETETCFVPSFGRRFQQRPPTSSELRWTPQQPQRLWAFWGLCHFCIKTRVKCLCKLLVRAFSLAAGLALYARKKLLTQASSCGEDGDLGLPQLGLPGRVLHKELGRKRCVFGTQGTHVLQHSVMWLEVASSSNLLLGLQCGHIPGHPTNQVGGEGAATSPLGDSSFCSLRCFTQSPAGLF